MSGAGVKYVALGAYANDYAQYITTAEECAKADYLSRVKVAASSSR